MDRQGVSSRIQYEKERYYVNTTLQKSLKDLRRQKTTSDKGDSVNYLKTAKKLREGRISAGGVFLELDRLGYYVWLEVSQRYCSGGTSQRSLDWCVRAGGEKVVAKCYDRCLAWALEGVHQEQLVLRSSLIAVLTRRQLALQHISAWRDNTESELFDR